MNWFDYSFFSKYLSENEEMLFICHKHFSLIVDKIIIWLFFWVILPSFFYLNNTLWIVDLIPVLYFEIYLFIIYLIVIYNTFDWYNDVWIITNKWIIDVNWKYFSSDVVYTWFEDISWAEIEEESFWDSMLKRWTIVLHLQWEWAQFILEWANDPQEVVNYIKESSDIIQKQKDAKVKEQENMKKDVNTLFIETMQKVVQDYIEKNQSGEFDENPHWMTDEELEKLEKIKSRKSTIDLSHHTHED